MGQQYRCDHNFVLNTWLDLINVPVLERSDYLPVDRVQVIGCSVHYWAPMYTLKLPSTCTSTCTCIVPTQRTSQFYTSPAVCDTDTFSASMPARSFTMQRELLHRLDRSHEHADLLLADFQRS